jgi:hypothetical protein
MNLDDGLGVEQRRKRHGNSSAVMPALVAGIHVFAASLRSEDVDGRDELGHDADHGFRRVRSTFYLSMNARILSLGWLISSTPFEWPYGPMSLPVSTELPAAASCCAAASTSGS